MDATLDLGYWESYEPVLEYDGYVPPVDVFQQENVAFPEYGEPTGIYAPSWWDKTVSYGKTAVDFGMDVFKTGSKVYGAYKLGQAAVVSREGLASQYPRRSYPEPVQYEMQSSAPATPADNRVSVVSSGQPGGGQMNMNTILIGAVVLGVALFLKGN